MQRSMQINRNNAIIYALFVIKFTFHSFSIFLCYLFLNIDQKTILLMVFNSEFLGVIMCAYLGIVRYRVKILGQRG